MVPKIYSVKYEHSQTIYSGLKITLFLNEQLIFNHLWVTKSLNLGFKIQSLLKHLAKKRGNQERTVNVIVSANPLYLNVNLSKYRPELIPASQSWIPFNRTLIIMRKESRPILLKIYISLTFTISVVSSSHWTRVYLDFHCFDVCQDVCVWERDLKCLNLPMPAPLLLPLLFFPRQAK